jgi:hypothetical protein
MLLPLGLALILLEWLPEASRTAERIFGLVSPGCRWPPSRPSRYSSPRGLRGRSRQVLLATGDAGVCSTASARFLLIVLGAGPCGLRRDPSRTRARASPARPGTLVSLIVALAAGDGALDPAFGRPGDGHLGLPAAVF